MVEIKRKNGESIESLLRRFTRRIQQSGVIIRVKENQFYQKKKTKRAIKENALRRKAIRAKKEYLKKIGKLDETDKFRRR